MTPTGLQVPAAAALAPGSESSVTLAQLNGVYLDARTSPSSDSGLGALASAGTGVHATDWARHGALYGFAHTAGSGRMRTTLETSPDNMDMVDASLGSVHGTPRSYGGGDDGGAPMYRFSPLSAVSSTGSASSMAAAVNATTMAFSGLSAAGAGPYGSALGLSDTSPPPVATPPSHPRRPTSELSGLGGWRLRVAGSAGALAPNGAGGASGDTDPSPVRESKGDSTENVAG